MLPSGARFACRSGDSLWNRFGVFHRLFFGAVLGGAIGSNFGGVLERSFEVVLGSRLGVELRGVLGVALQRHGHDFWPAIGHFLRQGWQPNFSKMGQNRVQKMDKIFVQNLATIFVQNLATGLGLHVKIHANRTSGISQLLPFFWTKILSIFCAIFWPESVPQNSFSNPERPRGRESIGSSGGSVWARL